MKKKFFAVALLCIISTFVLYASGNTDNTEVRNTNNNTTAKKTTVKEISPEELLNKKIESYKNDFADSLEENKFEKACEIFISANGEINSTNTVTDEATAVVSEMKNSLDEYISDYKFEKVKVPNTTIKNKAFSSPFIVRLKSNLHPAGNFPVTVTFPEVTEDGELAYCTKGIQTDEEGLITFECPVSSLPYNKTITFSLSPDNADLFDQLPSIELPCRVSTNMKSSGGSIAFVDFTKGGNPITTNSETSSLVLTALINKGFTRIGNCDFTSPIVAGNDVAVQKEASALFGKNVTYLIYGTIKYEKVEKVEDGYIVALKGNMKVRNILEDKELLVSEQIIEIKEKSEWAATNTARKKLAAAFADQVLYGI